MPTEKFSFTLTGSFTDSTAEMDRITFDENDPLAVALSSASYDYNFSEVHEYSDLDIQQWSLELDTEYEITQDLALGVGVGMYFYEEDDPYLSDDSGDLYIVSASLNYVF